FEIRIDIPRVPALGLVSESLQEISANVRRGTAGIGFGRSQRFRMILQIEKAGDAAGLWVDDDAKGTVLHRIFIGGDKMRRARPRVGWLRGGTHKVCFVAESRWIRRDE